MCDVCVYMCTFVWLQIQECHDTDVFSLWKNVLTWEFHITHLILCSLSSTSSQIHSHLPTHPPKTLLQLLGFPCASDQLAMDLGLPTHPLGLICSSPHRASGKHQFITRDSVEEMHAVWRDHRAPNTVLLGHVSLTSWIPLPSSPNPVLWVFMMI